MQTSLYSPHRLVSFRSAVLVFILSIGFYSSLGAQRLTPENALRTYIDNGDPSFRWEITDSVSGNGLTMKRVIFTSQVWQGMVWKHELVLMTPDKLSFSKALLFVQGGECDDQGNPKQSSFENPLLQAFGTIAVQNSAVVAVLSQIPRQPIFGGKVEDQISAETLIRFEKTGDFTLPIWLPMTKGAIRAMDVVEQATAKLSKPVNGFVVSGGSKRGWTTWLTAAMENRRVIGVVPMVIDVVNMPVNIAYQKYMYGSYSEAIGDYTDAGFTDKFATPAGKALLQMIDPYSYRVQLTCPKLIINATNDQYWTVDALKNYLYDIPGENRVAYIPNVNHSLGDKRGALNAASAFFYYMASGQPMPNPEYSIVAGAETMKVKTRTSAEGLSNVVIWSADSETKDFRKVMFVGKPLDISNRSEFMAEMPYPTNGFRAFYVAFEYKHPTSGATYSLTTRMYVASPTELFDKPYEIGQ